MDATSPAASPVQNSWWLPLDPTNIASPVINNASVQKLIHDSADASQSLQNCIDSAKEKAKAHDGGRLRLDIRSLRWFLLCHQQRLQLQAQRHNCIKLVEYILRLHAALAANGSPVVMEPLPEEIAQYVGVVAVRVRQ